LEAAGQIQQSTHVRRRRRRRHRAASTVRLERTLDRSAGSFVAIVVLAGLVIGLAWQGGGFFPAAYLRAGAIAFIVIAGLLIARPPSYAISPEAAIAIGCLLAFAVWSLLSTAWSSSPPTGLADAQRNLMYVGILALAVLAAGSGRLARFAIWCVLTSALVIVLAGLGSRLFPSGAPVPVAHDPSLYRLSYPLGYWNSFGALAGMTAVLAIGMAADRRTPTPLRAAASAGGFLAVVAMYFSLSRGAWLAVAFGVAVLLMMSPDRGRTLIALGIAGLAAALAIVHLRSYPALTENPLLGHGQAAAGHSYAPWLLVLALCCAAAQAGANHVERVLRAQPGLRLAGRRLTVSALVLIVLSASAVYFVSSTAVDGRTAAALHSVGHYLGVQWHEFLRPAGAPATGTARLTTAKTTRGDVYRVALDQFASHPLFGAGAGSFQSAWYRHRRYAAGLQNAHSLYLETLGEMGVVGGMVLLLFIGCFIRGAARSRRHPTALARAQTAAVAGAVTVWLVHAGVDWDWQMPAFTGVALLLMATIFPVGRRGGTATVGRRRRMIVWGLAGVSSIVATYLAIAGVQAQRLTEANRLGASGAYRAALREAGEITMSPASDQAQLTRAYALQDLGRLRSADQAFRRAADEDPSNWVIRRDWAAALLEADDLARARDELSRARSLNPKMPIPPRLAVLVGRPSP
jgi:hypothetical protein